MKRGFRSGRGLICCSAAANRLPDRSFAGGRGGSGEASGMRANGGDGSFIITHVIFQEGACSGSLYDSEALNLSSNVNIASEEGFIVPQYADMLAFAKYIMTVRECRQSSFLMETRLRIL